MRFRDIPGSENWLDVIPVREGWSGDEKFRVLHADGRTLLVRISPTDRAMRRQQEYRTLKAIHAKTDVNIPDALDFGPCEGGVYTLLTWVNGTPAEKLLPALPVQQQRELGMQAGRIARTLHSVPAPDDQEPWQDYFSRKMARKVEMNRNCELKTPECADFEAYVLANGQLINGRPNTFQHGDLHVGNMVVDENGVLGVVDFDRMSFGDPWEEFNRITWSAQCSPAFASGMLTEYFGGEVPQAFWKLLALYMASNQLSSIPWAIPFGQQEIDVMIRQNREVRSWYPGAYGDGAPNWYTPPVQYGTQQDIYLWMELVRHIAWNFPGLETETALDEHQATVLRFMGKRQALCVKADGCIAGVLLFSRGHNKICCLGVHPQYRRRGIASALLSAALEELDASRPITVSTFRQEDEKGTAPRALYCKFGFEPAELIEEFGYPNQKFIKKPM